MDVVEAVTVRKKSHTFRGVEEKRRIVEGTLKEGASVSSVARAHGVNANQVFQWRRLYRDGLLDTAASGNELRLLPVAVSDEARGDVAGRLATGPLEEVASGGPSTGMIELTLARGQVRIEGAVDRETLRTVLGCLLR
ncbi:MAG: IS66-like element accessory protein TnpA [Gemmatimonadaceae bacterium]